MQLKRVCGRLPRGRDHPSRSFVRLGKTLEVAEACNGLSMLTNLSRDDATPTIMLIPLINWKRIVVLASAIPIAPVSNIVRISSERAGAITSSTGTEAKKLAHDWTGILLMMPLALILVGLELLVLSWLVDDSEYSARGHRPTYFRCSFPEDQRQDQGQNAE